jgi:23S rRNA (pseudouridine1915-N3)-methyltransferase
MSITTNKYVFVLVAPGCGSCSPLWPMNWTIYAVGKPALPWARAGIDDYASRLKRAVKVEVIYLKPAPAEQIAKQMLEASTGAVRVLMDERGKQQRSIELADWIRAAELRSVKRVALMIGGADGHAEILRREADALWSLSDMTLQHELALVVLLEQLYRGYSIMRGEPYHREG